MKNKTILIIFIIAVIGLFMTGCNNEEDVSLQFKVINNSEEPIVKVDVNLLVFYENWWEVNIVKGKSKTFITG